MAEYNVVTKEVEYIPDWDDNADKAEPIKATLKYITDAERTRCSSVTQDAKENVNVELNYELLVKYGLGGFENFKVGGEEIKTAKQFLSLSGFHLLLIELGSKIFTMNARTDSKNSE